MTIVKEFRIPMPIGIKDYRKGSSLCKGHGAGQNLISRLFFVIFTRSICFWWDCIILRLLSLVRARIREPKQRYCESKLGTFIFSAPSLNFVNILSNLVQISTFKVSLLRPNLFFCHYKLKPENRRRFQLGKLFLSATSAILVWIITYKATCYLM